METSVAKKVFSNVGYNQLLVDGQVDNTLEAAFSKVETPLPRTFAALEAAATNQATTLSPTIYEQLCWYCAFLKRISPFAKAAAPANFLMQVNNELEHGDSRTLSEVLNAPDIVIKCLCEEYSLGRRAIIDSENFLQLVYRIEFRQKYQYDYIMFRHNANWAICHSPLELPLADIALIELPVNDRDATFYVLPISPRLLLKGQIKWGNQMRSSDTIVRSASLSADEAQYWVDAICLAAVTELVSACVIPDVAAIRARAKANGVAYHKIVSPNVVMSAGRRDFTARFALRMVPEDEYVRFVHAFIQPPDR